MNEKVRRPREAKIYRVTINGETHFVKAKTAQSALKFAVAETVSVRVCKQSDMEDMAKALASGDGILDAAA